MMVVLVRMFLLLTFRAVFLSAGAVLSVFRFNALPVWAGVRVVVHFTVSGQIFRGVGMECTNFSH